MAQIHLQRAGLALQEINNQHVWPLKVTATLMAGATMPSAKIFVYHSAMTDDAYQGDLFECVASVQQYWDLPEDAPTLIEEGGLYTVPYYRSAVLYFNCRSPLEAEELWADIQADITDLVENAASYGNLSNQEEAEI